MVKRAILRFADRYFFLSNIFPCRITINNIAFPSAEHAFQCFKCVSHEDFKKILNASSPKEARRLGRKIQLRSDWEGIKDKVMYHIIKAKFIQNKELAEKLIETYPLLLIEGNYWRDTYWGVDLRKPDSRSKYGYVGLNRLGEILMKVRVELISQGA